MRPRGDIGAPQPPTVIRQSEYNPTPSVVNPDAWNDT